MNRKIIFNEHIICVFPENIISRFDVSVNDVSGEFAEKLQPENEAIMLGSDTVYKFGRADSVGVILIGNRCSTLRITHQLPTLLGKGGTVVGQRIANGIIGNGVTVKGGQLILPGCISVGVVDLCVSAGGRGGGIGILARAEEALAEAKTSSGFLGFVEWVYVSYIL